MFSTKTTGLDWLRLATLLVLLMAVSGCEFIGNVFQAGVWVGIVVVVVVVAVIGFVMSKLRRP